MTRQACAADLPLTSLAALVLALAGAVLGVTPSLAQETSPSASAPPQAASAEATDEARADLLEDMPFELGGFEPVIEITRGEEHLANLDPEATGDRETSAELMRLLEATGADIDDMTSGYALVSLDDFFAFVVALRIEGAEEGTLLPAYLPILLDDLIDPSAIEGWIAERPVLAISSEGSEGEPVLLYVYDAGDTVWMLQGPDHVVEAVLGRLP